MDKNTKEMTNFSEKEKLEWIQTYEAISEMNQESGLRTKMISKIKENPFVPVGMLATTIALSYGVYTMKTGNKQRSQLMMRCRVLAQGFTVGALLAGVAYGAFFKPSKEKAL